MTRTNYYHVGICGQVSTGKSTCLNALTGQYLSQISLKRSTKRVLKFYNTELDFDNKHKPTDIKKIIENINENDSHEQTEFHIHMPLCDNNNNIVFYDFPGFNDGQESIQGMEKLFTDEMINLDLIIFIVDANSAMIHKSERDVFQMLATRLNANHDCYRYTKLIVVFNKYHFDNDEINDDINKDVRDIINDAKKHMDGVMNTLTNIKHEYAFVSFRNMMIYNIFANSGNVDDISLTEFNQVLIEFYGKKEAIKKLDALKKNKIKKKDLDCINITTHENNLMSLIKKLSNFETHTNYWLSILKNAINTAIEKTIWINESFDGQTLKYSKYDECVEIFKKHQHYQTYNKDSFIELVYETILNNNLCVLTDAHFVVDCISLNYMLYIDVLDGILCVMEQFGIIDAQKQQLPISVIEIICAILNNLKSDIGWVAKKRESLHNRTLISALFWIIIMYTDEPINYLSYFTNPWIILLDNDFSTLTPSVLSVSINQAKCSYFTFIKTSCSACLVLHTILFNAIDQSNNDVVKNIYATEFIIHYNAKVNDSLLATVYKADPTLIDKVICLHSAYIKYKYDHMDPSYKMIRTTQCYNADGLPETYKKILDTIIDKGNDGNYWDGLFNTDLELIKFVRYCKKYDALPDTITMDINLYINERLLMLYE